MTRRVTLRHKMSYTPMFGKMLLSSIWSEPLHVRVLWVSMLLSQGRGGVIEGNSYTLHRLSNLTLEQVEDGLEVLMGPDRLRPDQPNEGRRLERVENGWKVLNSEVYQKEFERINAAARQRKSRERKPPKNGRPLPGERQYVAAVKDGAIPLVQDQIVEDNLPPALQ